MTPSEPSEARSPDAESVVDHTVYAAQQKIDEMTDAATEAVDRAIDKATGVPTEEGEIETFTYDGASIVAERRGDAASDRTLVLIHGIGMGRKVFADLSQRAEKDALVVAIDLPGYGEAEEPRRTPTIERMADLVAAYLRALGRGPVTLLGHSMGTQVVTEVAVRHPETVAHLILVAPTVDRHNRNPLTQLTRLGLDLLGESAKVLLLGTREYVRAGPHLRRKMRAMLVHRPELSYPKIAVPTLVMRGELDLVVPQEWFEEVVAAVPGASSYVVEGHHHETLIHDAEPADREIRRWLRADRAGKGPADTSA